jgi:hypothetical protein
MKHAIGKYLEYLRSVKNSSPHTVMNYGKDLGQLLAYLSPPGAAPPALAGVTHHMIREFVGHLHDTGLAKSSVARKLAALRSFFKYCVREGHLKENPARLGIFYENAINKMLHEIVDAIEPEWCVVRGEFTPRGGLNTSVFARWPESKNTAGKYLAAKRSARRGKAR